MFLPIWLGNLLGLTYGYWLVKKGDETPPALIGLAATVWMGRLALFGIGLDEYSGRRTRSCFEAGPFLGRFN